VYGLTEWSRDALRGARLIANPGCYPTAALLALSPFARASLVSGNIIVDAKSGVSGAGRGAGADYLFTELTESTRAYGLGGHRHRPEIEQGLADAGASVEVTFVPHLVPQSRGLLATCYMNLADDLDDAGLTAILVDATIVRMILVPAIMELLGDKAWWAPRWLKRLVPEVDLEGETPRPTAA